MFARTNTSGVTFGVIESKYKTFHETDETQWALCMSLYLRVPWIQVAQFLVCLYSQRSVYLTIWEEKGTTEDEMAGWHHRLDGREFEWTLGDGDGQGGLACCNSWGRKESDTTERLNWTELKLGRILHSFNIFPVLESNDTEEILKQHPTQLDSGYFSLHCLTLCSQLPKLSYWWGTWDRKFEML